MEDYLGYWLLSGADTFCVDVSGAQVNQGTSATWATCPDLPSEGCD
jgi:hypothetical protein